MTSSIKRDLLVAAALAVFAAALYLPGMGSFGLLDPDEPFYCLTAREMLLAGNPATPLLFGEPQFEKPVFFYWLLYASFCWFGVTEAAARLVPALGGIATVLVTYAWGRALFGSRVVAAVSAVILATAGQFVVLSRIVLTDIYLCLFVTAALACFTSFDRRPDSRGWAGTAFFFFCGLGFLTKGPLGLAIPLSGVAAYCVWAGRGHVWRAFPWAKGLLIFAATALPWYARMALEHGAWFLEHFFIHENVRRIFVAEHRSLDRAHFYPLGMLLGFFPWSFLVPGAVVYVLRRGILRDRRAVLLASAFWPTFFFFATAKSKLLSYVFPLFPALALACGWWGVVLWRACREKGAPCLPLKVLALAALGVLPPGLLAGTAVYASRVGLDLGWVIAGIAAVFVPASWAGLILIWKGRLRAAFACVALGTLALSTLAFTRLLPASDPVFSSRQTARQGQPAYAAADTFLLASKLFVRGVVYYTGNANAGVLAEHPHKVFYTRHPITFVSNGDDLAELARRYRTIYGFFRPKEYRALRQIVDDRVRVEVASSGPQRVLVRIEANA